MVAPPEILQLVVQPVDDALLPVQLRQHALQQIVKLAALTMLHFERRSPQRHVVLEPPLRWPQIWKRMMRRICGRCGASSRACVCAQPTDIHKVRTWARRSSSRYSREPTTASSSFSPDFSPRTSLRHCTQARQRVPQPPCLSVTYQADTLRNRLVPRLRRPHFTALGCAIHI